MRVVGRVEETPEQRALAHERKVRTGHRLGGHTLGTAAVTHRDVARLVGGHGAERRVVGLERTIVDDREAESIRRIVRVDPEELVWRGVRQRVQQHRANDADHAGRGTKAEANGEDDCRRQRRRAREAANAVEHVAPDVREETHRVAERGASAVHQEVKRIEKVLPLQPSCSGAIAVAPAAQFEELPEIVFNRSSIGVVEQESQQPAHVTPCSC